VGYLRCGMLIASTITLLTATAIVALLFVKA
jgi:hypothetical protein